MGLSDDPPRREHAVRRDDHILAAARARLIAHPDSSMADIAAAAGVGMSALYRRFGSKAALLRRLAVEGDAIAAAALELATAGLDAGEDGWTVFERFVRTVDAGDVIALAGLTGGMAGRAAAEVAETDRLNSLGESLLRRLHEAGVLRAGLGWYDLGTVLGAIGTIRGDGPDRTARQQRRMLDIVLPGLRAGGPPLTEDPAGQRDFRAPGRAGPGPAADG